MTATQKTARSTAATSEGFTDEERAAMKERAREVKASARGASRAVKAAEDEAVVLAPKLWYGMPAYALDGKVVCFFQSAEKFRARYATLGFSDRANLDEGTVWPASYALKELTAADEARIGELVGKAVG